MNEAIHAGSHPTLNMTPEELEVWRNSFDPDEMGGADADNLNTEGDNGAANPDS